MKDFYKNTRMVIDTYNSICDKVMHSQNETNEEDDEFLCNFCIHLAHSLIKDTGLSEIAREELGKVADIINDVIR